MEISEKEYFTKRAQQIERRKKIISLISMMSFFGSLLFTGALSVYNNIKNPQTNVPLTAEATLQQQVHGYELVLQREPENQLALEKLSLLRLQLHDVKGSVAILEKLTKQHPDRQDYKALLQQMSQKGNSLTGNRK